MSNKVQAKEALDKLISISRVHLYKPIQIAEILYHHRIYNDIDLSNVEDYRKLSKKWRDDISIELLGRKCTSSAKFQDNLFEENAIPPHVLSQLGEENIRTNGAVEAYIYKCFEGRYSQLSNALNYCFNATPSTFYVQEFIDSFWKEAGLKRSLDKVYEIIVYALFSTLVNALNLQVEIFVDEESFPLLQEFEDFSKKIMCIDANKKTHIQDAKVYRVGVTNAADRGLDMYSNWGPAIQIKHLSLDVDLAKDIISSVSSDKIVIVCKDAEVDIIMTVLRQIDWDKRIQDIVTEKDLIEWYDKALRGTFSEILSAHLLTSLTEEISLEFPSIESTPDVLKDRNYGTLSDDFWKL